MSNDNQEQSNQAEFAQKKADKTTEQPIPADVVARIIQAQIGTKKQSDLISSHMEDYFKRFASYRSRFTDLEWYHIFLDFSDKLHSLPPSPVAGDFEQWAKDYADKIFQDNPVSFRAHISAECYAAQMAAYDFIRLQKAASPSHVGDWSNDMVRSYIHYFNIGDWKKCTDEQMSYFKKVYKEDHPNLVPNPSRAGERVDQQFLEFKSAGHQKTRDFFTISMEDENGKAFVTEFNGTFGRLLFDGELIRKAAAVRKALEILVEGYSDEWPEALTKDIERLIKAAKTWTEPEQTERAGEISPVLRERVISFANWRFENFIKLANGGWRKPFPSMGEGQGDATEFNDDQLYGKWLEEAPPTAAPEVKEEGMTDEQVKIESLERVVKKVIVEAEEYKVILESLYRDLFRLSPDTKIDFDKIREMYKTIPPAKPVKDTPVTSSTVNIEDVEKQPSYAGFTLTEQPAHVPDPKGEIPEDLRQIIEDMWSDGGNTTGAAPYSYKKGSVGMYRKMKADNDAAHTGWNKIANQLHDEIATLTQQREEYRVLLQRIGENVVLDWRQEAADLIAKYSSSATKPQQCRNKEIYEVNAKLEAARALMETAYEEKDRAINNEQKLIDDLAAKSEEAEAYRAAGMKYVSTGQGSDIREALLQYPKLK